MGLGDAHRFGSVRPPARHAEGVRDDAGSGLELVDKTWLQLADQLGQEIDGHHRSLRNVGDKHVALHEAHALANTRARGVFARGFDEPGIELDAKPARAELARGGDDDAPITRAEVDDQVLGAGSGQLEHALDDVAGRGDERRPPVGLVRGGAERPAEGDDDSAMPDHAPTVAQKKSPALAGRVSIEGAYFLASDLVVSDLALASAVFAFDLALAFFSPLVFFFSPLAALSLAGAVSFFASVPAGALEGVSDLGACANAVNANAEATNVTSSFFNMEVSYPDSDPTRI